MVCARKTNPETLAGKSLVQREGICKYEVWTGSVCSAAAVTCALRVSPRTRVKGNLVKELDKTTRKSPK